MYVEKAMIINRYYQQSNRFKYLIKSKINKVIYKRNRAKKVKEYDKQINKINLDQVPIFNTIFIETFNRCNGECPFCPVNRFDDSRVPTKMTDELFDRIVQQLKEVDYSGKIALYCNNEPLLDLDLEKRAKILKQELPHVFSYIFTNGTLLTEEKYINLVGCFDKIVIDNYNDDLKINNNLVPIVELCKNNPEWDSKTEIHLRKLNEVLSTRGGNSPNNKKRKQRNYSCILPFVQFVIRPDGKISLCCCDALGEVTLGDINTESIIEIWNSDKYKTIRKKVQTDISSIDLCKYCDFIKYVY